jgi:ribonuclease HI
MPNQQRSLPTHTPTTDGNSLYSSPGRLLRTRRWRRPTRTVQARLYFDGGSRGNPGPAGSGAVLVEADAATDTWNVVWWTSHFLGDKATNNEAEHEALLRGARECVRRYDRVPINLTIIGDSELVLGQVAGHTRPQQRNTHRATELTQQVLRDIPAATLRHTLRTGNKMADWLANTAMDSRETRVAGLSWGATDAHLTSLMPADIQHDTRPLLRPLQLLPQLSQLLQQADGRTLPTTRKRTRS